MRLEVLQKPAGSPSNSIFFATGCGADCAGKWPSFVRHRRHIITTLRSKMTPPRLATAILAALAALVAPVDAFSVGSDCRWTSAHRGTRCASVSAQHTMPAGVQTATTALRSAAPNVNDSIDSPSSSKSDEASAEAVEKKSEEELTDADWKIVDQILAGADDDAALEGMVAAALPNMHPRLVLRLRSEAAKADSGEEDADDAEKEGRIADLRKIGAALTSLFDERLKGGRDLLAELLKSGEVRKLDGAIGKASREGKLDMAFFTVLNMNIRDAQYEASQLSEEERAKLAEVTVPTDDDSGVADRLQILQHIYTRCQEELEKSVSPGAGLLNKLLRTEDINIRANQLRHYLGPQPNVVVTPDGKEVPLQGNKEALVPPSQLIEAIGTAVKQIRTVEKAGGTDVATAAGLVESCRQVAIESRLAIAEAYGVDSKELKDFESGLQPVFRPSGEGSEYIKGN